VKIKTRYIATVLATAAIGAVGLAPAALAATGTTGAPALDTAVVADPAAPNPGPGPTGGDPQVPYGTNINPDVDNFDGNSLAY
jgi:hypothetical protein